MSEHWLWVCPRCQRKFRVANGVAAPEACRQCQSVPVAAIVPPPRRKGSRTLLISCLAGAAFVCVLVAVFAMGTTNDTPPFVPPEVSATPVTAVPESPQPATLTDEQLDQIELSMFEAAKAKLIENLKVPESAQFPSTHKCMRERTGNILAVTIDDRVIAKNALGVPLQSDWSATVHYNIQTDVIDVCYVQLGEQYVYQSEMFQGLVAGVQAMLDAESEWETAKIWSGSGATTTEQFTMLDTEWKLRWRTSGTFLAFVHTAQGALVSTISSNDQSAHESFVHRKGTFYIEVTGSGEWALEAQRLKARPEERSDK
jgi:hypothetical protein